MNLIVRAIALMTATIACLQCPSGKYTERTLETAREFEKYLSRE